MYELMKGMSARGMMCDMLCAAYKRGKGHVTVLDKNSRIIARSTLVSAAATMISPSMITCLRRIANDYDIIHVHHPDPMACIALFLSGYKGKVVLHWHSDIVKQKQLFWFFKPLQNWLIKRADLVLCTTPIYMTQSPYLQQVQHKCNWLPIGIKPIRYREQMANEVRERYEGKKVILSVGRLVAYKGYRYLVEAASMLPDDYVVLIGGTGVLAEELKAQIEYLGLEEKVLLLGRINDRDLAAHYWACDLFCLPSVMKTEAFGIVQIEAMSCGKPVVTTKIPESGVPWVNEHGVSGLNVTPGNAKELADAIMEITKDEETYKRFSEGARERFNKVFTRDRMIEKCINYYKNEQQKQ